MIESNIFMELNNTKLKDNKLEKKKENQIQMAKNNYFFVFSGNSDNILPALGVVW